MAPKAVDYSKTIIYKIVCLDPLVTDCYVGHTTDFRKRKNQHKHACLNPNDKGYNLNVYKTIRDNGGWINWDMILIEKYPCNDSLEACKRERYYLEQLGATMNKILPSRTEKEYYQDNKEKFKTYHVEYRKNNRDTLLKKKSDYYYKNKEKINQKINCDCKGTYLHNSKARHMKTKKHQDYLKTLE